MVYNLYPAVDNVTYNFPPVVIDALAATPELRSTIVPMTQLERNDLSGAKLWDGRLIFNLNTKKINRYDATDQLWYEIDSDNKVLKTGDTMTGALTLSGAPTQNLHAATKNYVDTYRPGRNCIVNGDFSVNQRNVASTSTLYGFVHDRWQNFCNGGTVTYSTQSPTLGNLPESPKSFARMYITGQGAAGDFAELVQGINDVRTLSGKTVTVSFWAKAASGTPKVAVALTQNFGTGGSSAVEIYGGQVTISSSWTRYTLTFAIPSLSGKTVGANSSVTFRLWLSSGSTYNSYNGSIGIQNNTFDIWGVQLEEGLVATPFEQKAYEDNFKTISGVYAFPSSIAVEAFGTVVFRVPFGRVLPQAPFVITANVRSTFNNDGYSDPYSLFSAASSSDGDSASAQIGFIGTSYFNVHVNTQQAFTFDTNWGISWSAVVI